MAGVGTGQSRLYISNGLKHSEGSKATRDQYVALAWLLACCMPQGMPTALWGFPVWLGQDLALMDSMLWHPC